MAKRNLRGLRAIVTGASGGIGAALARELVDVGTRVLITARRADRLRSLTEELRGRGGDVEWIAGDLTDPAIRQQLVTTAQSRWAGLDILINNAGAGRWGAFSSGSESQLRDILELDFFAPVELTRLALPLLRESPAGLIVNMGSVLGHRAVPLKSEYCAAKFALHGWSDALRAELARDGVDVLLVSPSTTATEFFDRAGETRRPSAMSPAKVAQLTRRAMQAGRHEVILSWGGKLLVWLDRLCPPLMNRFIARYAK